MHKAVVFACLLLTAGLSAGGPTWARPVAAVPADSQVRTYKAAGLELRVARDGAIGAVAGGGQRLPLLDRPGGFAVAEYSGARKEARPLAPLPRPADGALGSAYDGGKLTLTVDVKEAEGFLSFHGS
jgi:hypothetical protein